jgi:hypothetical protein
MIDPEPFKRDPNAGPKAEKRFCAIQGLVPALAALPPALERPMVGLQEPTSGESRFRTGTREDRPMDFKDRRIWYAVAAVIIVLIIIGYATGWFSGAPPPPPQQ